MTDEELAAKIEEHAKHGSHAYPPLLYAAAERIYAISAHVALLKASLAHSEREDEKATASAEPFGYFRVTPFGWEDCAETDDGAIPLYAAPQPDRVAEMEREACAALCDRIAYSHIGGERCAALIRARGANGDE